ncbi:MAG: von Willebrand factor type A domain-containing protein [Bacteroidota bacterium]
MKTNLIIFITVLVMVISGHAQTGSITGKVFDELNQPMANVNVYVEYNGSRTGSPTDTAGQYTVKPLAPGTYIIHAMFIGYEMESVNDVIVKPGMVTSIDFHMKPSTKVLQSVEVREYRVPLIEKDAACMSAIVYVDAAQMRGSRGNAKTKKTITTVTGGVPANYGPPAPDYNTESYDIINENRFLTVKNEPLSTFSVDVDKASYANMRRFVNTNQLPPLDAVRIEEMINYFDYDYPQPRGDDPFSVSMELGKCPWNAEHELLLVGLQGVIPDADEIPHGNLVFLIDVSGSMQDENKLPLLKSAFKLLVEKLREEDKVSIVVYAGSSGLVLEPTPGGKKEKILNAINGLNAGGSTAGGEGIKLAYKVAREHFKKGGNNRVILATDGDFNMGASSDAEMVKLIEEERESGIFLSVLGFGMGNYKDSKMEQLSNAGNGNYAYIDDILEAKKVFTEELWGTLYTIAKDVKIQIEFNPAKVSSYRLIGYENRMLEAEDFNDDKKDAGEIGAGHRVTALYEIIPAGQKELPPGVDSLEYQVQRMVQSDNMMTVKLRYKEPDGVSSRLIVKRVTSEEIFIAENSDNYNFAASVAAFGMLLRNSEHRGTIVYKDVIRLAKMSKGTDDNGYRAEFIKLVEKVQLMDDRYAEKANKY